MARSRLRLAVLALVCLTTLAVLLLVRSDADDPGDAGTVRRPADATADATQPLRDETTPTLRPAGARVPASPAAAGGAESAHPPIAHVEVVGADGTRVASALIRLLRIEAGPRPTRDLIGAWVREIPTTVPRPDAPFHLEVLRPRDAEGKVLPLGSTLVGPFPADTDDLRVELPIEQSIAGRILDAEGRALPGATVLALFDDGKGIAWEEHGRVVTDADGVFRIGGLRAGTYRLEVSPVGPNARPDLAVVPAGTEDVVLRCRPGVVVDLEIVDSDGAPIPGCEVRLGESLSRGPGFGLGVEAGRARTDEAGRVSFEGLDPDYCYVLEVRPPHARKDVVPIRGWSWTPVSDTLRLARSLQVAGRVQYIDGRPFRHAEVSVEPQERGVPSLRGWSGEDGTFVVDHVPKGGPCT